MASGDATGDTLTITLTGATRVTKVGLVPGYAKVDPCTGDNRFVELRRISKVRWSFDGGAFVDQNLDVNNASMQYITVPGKVVTGTILLRIEATVAPGNPALDHTPISEIGVG